jgi:hypothetical protein
MGESLPHSPLAGAGSRDGALRRRARGQWLRCWSAAFPGGFSHAMGESLLHSPPAAGSDVG